MTGEEIFALFGQDHVRKLEEEHRAIGAELDEIGGRLQIQLDPEELERMRDRINELRNHMRDIDREIRKEARRYGELRGPVSF